MEMFATQVCNDQKATFPKSQPPKSKWVDSVGYVYPITYCPQADIWRWKNVRKSAGGKNPNNVKNRGNYTNLVKVGYILTHFGSWRHFFSTLIHPPYDSRSFYNIQNFKFPLAVSKIWRRVHPKKSLQALLAGLQIFAGLGINCLS